MEQATVEQAEPQGSAARERDTSAEAPVTQEPASSESFGSIYRERVLQRAARQSGRAEASSAATETSAADEQPAPQTAADSRPGAATDTADGAAPGAADSSPADQPRLSRAQRKALRNGEATPEPSAETTAGDASSVTEDGDDGDPVVARVARVEQTVSEGLSRLEGLLKGPTPAESDPTQDPDSARYRTLFGDDAEFEKRAQTALHGSQTGQYLSGAEADELAKWATNREARDYTTGRAIRQYQGQFSSVVLAAGEEFGVPSDSLTKPGTTMREIFRAFVAKGEANRAAELASRDERISRLEAANRQLADQNEAIEARLPASLRTVLNGGAAAESRAASMTDRTRMSGTQLIRAGAQAREAQQGRRSRPGGR